MSTRFTRSTAPRRLKLAVAQSVRSVALGMLVSFCVTGLALGKDDGDGEEDAAKAKSALPNFYLDMRTIYATVPAGALSIGFSTPPLLSRLPFARAVRHGDASFRWGVSWEGECRRAGKRCVSRPP